MTPGAQSGSQALKDLIERNNPGATEDPPEHRLLVNTVGFLLQRQHTTGRYDVVAAGEVDRFGHISLRPAAPWRPATLAEYEARQAERRSEMAEHLIEEGLAAWRSVGSGDTELYATQEFLRRLAPTLAALPEGWRQWP